MNYRKHAGIYLLFESGKGCRMAKSELNVNKMMNKNTWEATFKLTGITRFNLKIKIGILLIRLACFIMNCGIIIERKEDDRNNNINS